MENASKALLMTASILVGLIILSLGIYLVNTFRTFSQDYNDSMEIKRMQQFNAEFTALATRSNISMHEILTLVNYANEFNSTNEIEVGDSQHIDVNIKLKTKTINLTNLETELKHTDYENKTDKFISDLLDGTYIIESKVNESAVDEGRYKYDYAYDKEKKIKIKTYYNCYACTDYSVSAQTGRVESITFTYKDMVKYEDNKLVT